MNNVITTLIALIITSVSFTSLATQNEPSTALVISGGVSLGVYEAGLNHVLIETLRNHEELGQSKLVAATGASAGAINALASGIRSCEASTETETVFDNAFRDIWIGVDIEQLLPTKYQNNYDTLILGGIPSDERPMVIKDAVLSRSIFVDTLEAIKKNINTGTFTAGCKVEIGIMVTYVTPTTNLYELADGHHVKLQEQSYVIPIVIKVREIKGKQKLVFENSKNIKKLEQNRNHILLPENHDKSIDIDSVLRAVLASSAFPVAFSSVKLGYCFKSGAGDDRGLCPANYAYATDRFIDGGYFNNTPIGLAVDLVDSSNQVAVESERKLTQKAKEQYIFLDPDELRSPSRVYSINDPSDKLDIKTQLKNAVSGVNTFRKMAVQNDYKIYFNDQKFKYRNLRPTSRYPELTGNYLGYFGAFFDRLLREYDYAAGVYDGMVFSASLICESMGEKNNPECEASEFRKLYVEILDSSIEPGLDANQALSLNELRGMINRFLHDEYGNSYKSNSWNDLARSLYEREYVSKYTIIIDAISTPDNQSFEEFLAKLDKEAFTSKEIKAPQFSKQLSYMIRRPEFWKNSLTKKILQREIYLEDREKGEFKKALSTAYLMIPYDITAGGEIGASRFPSSKHWLYRISPDQFGVDAVQTGVTIGWNCEQPLNVPVIDIDNWYVEFLGRLNFQIKDNDSSKTHYWDAGIGLRRIFPNTVLSSFGGAINVNQNFNNSNRYGDKYLPGGELNVGMFSERFRVAVGTRDMRSNYSGEDWTVKITLNNIDELIWAFGPDKDWYKFWADG